MPGTVLREHAFIVTRKLKPRRKELAQSPSVRAESQLDPEPQSLKRCNRLLLPPAQPQALRITSQEKAWGGRGI